MKKTLQILGAAFVIFLVVGGGLLGYAAYTGRHLDATSKAYVDAAIPAIVGHWSEHELMTRAAPQLVRGMTHEQVAKLFRWMRSSLGPMKKYCGSKGESKVFVSPQRGRTVSAVYSGCAQFQKGDATIKVTLLQGKDKAWQIFGFHVDSPVLVPH